MDDKTLKELEKAGVSVLEINQRFARITYRGEEYRVKPEALEVVKGFSFRNKAVFNKWLIDYYL